MAMGLSARALLKNWLSDHLLPLSGRSPHFHFGVPANYLASFFSPLVSGDLRLLSTNTCWYPLCDPYSLLTVTFLTGFHCSFQREDSINLTSIVSAGYHVTIYIRYIFFGLVGFYGISTIVAYVMPNPFYTYILDIYALVWLGFMAYQPL